MKSVKSDTIARTICLFLALINQILAISGKDILPFAEDDIYQICSLIATLITSAIAWWKNNSFTQPAIIADETLEEQKKLNKVIKG